MHHKEGAAMRNNPTTAARVRRDAARRDALASGHLRLPETLTSLAEQIETTALPIDLTKVSDPALAPAGKEYRRLRSQLTKTLEADESTDLVSGPLLISGRSHALTEVSPLRHSFHALNRWMNLPEGHCTVTVDISTVPFRALAHLAADPGLAELAAARDTYQELANQLEVARHVAKQTLFGVLAEKPIDTIVKRVVSNGHTFGPAGPEKTIDRLRSMIGPTLEYIEQMRPYDSALVNAQRLANRVANRGLGVVHQALTSRPDLFTPRAIALADTGTVTYLVPDEHDHLVVSFTPNTVSSEHVSAPVRARRD